MARTASITMPSIIDIVGRAPAVDTKSVMFFVYLSVCYSLELHSL